MREETFEPTGNCADRSLQSNLDAPTSQWETTHSQPSLEPPAGTCTIWESPSPRRNSWPRCKPAQRSYGCLHRIAPLPLRHHPHRCRAHLGTRSALHRQTARSKEPLCRAKNAHQIGTLSLVIPQNFKYMFESGPGTRSKPIVLTCNVLVRASTLTHQHNNIDNALTRLCDPLAEYESQKSLIEGDSSTSHLIGSIFHFSGGVYKPQSRG